VGPRDVACFANWADALDVHAQLMECGKRKEDDRPGNRHAESERRPIGCWLESGFSHAASDKLWPRSANPEIGAYKPSQKSVTKDICLSVFGEGELGGTRLLFAIQIIPVVFQLIFEAANVKTPDMDCPRGNPQR